ncbi:MAG: phospholipase D/Transphosphatidylase [Deltaproteobacteria bacterium]|nr:phospholipase D/Transphosphatidylase [Deltaproteobacteria bacterium]
MRRLSAVIGIVPTLFALAACVEADVEDGETDSFGDGKADGGMAEGSPEALGVLALVNDAGSTAGALKSGAHVTSRVATGIVKHRDGADGLAGTADDDRFDSLAELDAIPFVGPATLAALLDHARDRGLVQTGAKIEVIFSPQPAAQSHNARIAKLVHDAQQSVDIAMYSYSDAGIAAALADATARGVKVRFLFETAGEDKSLTDPAARAASRSGKLEAVGVDVRYVNKILHHKFAIIDGPRDEVARASSARIVMGSANWSNTGATVFDENTMFIENSAELGAAYQQEFDALWRGSRDFTGPAPSQGQSSLAITPAQVADEAGLSVLFTRDNFVASGTDGATWRVDPAKLRVSDELVAAIGRAKTSIHIGSAHIRLRPVAEALIARKQADPALDIRVHLDQQEWISASGDAKQRAEVADCVARATTSVAEAKCRLNDFLFSKALVDAGIEVRFKSYAYRWDASYALQMHSKYLIIDGQELFSGSYNLSMNSEQGTFENALHLSGPQFAPLIGQFEQNFVSMWELGRAEGLLAKLDAQVSNDPQIPLLFPSMALTWSELDALRILIRQNCTAADSPDFRSNPAAHKVCTR